MGLEVSWNLKAREADRTRRGTKTVGRYERVLWVRRSRPETKTRGQIVYLGWGVVMAGLVGQGRRQGGQESAQYKGWQGSPKVTTVSPRWREGASVSCQGYPGVGGWLRLSPGHLDLP